MHFPGILQYLYSILKFVFSGCFCYLILYLPIPIYPCFIIFYISFISCNYLSSLQLQTNSLFSFYPYSSIFHNIYYSILTSYKCPIIIYILFNYLHYLIFNNTTLCFIYLLPVSYNYLVFLCVLFFFQISLTAFLLFLQYFFYLFSLNFLSSLQLQTILYTPSH